MAGPSSIVERDSVMAMRLQLREAGAGEVSLSSLLDLPQHAEPSPAQLHDASLAFEIRTADLSIARDAAFAHMLARQEAGHLSAGPSSKSQPPSAPDTTKLLGNLSLPPIKCSICLELTPAVARFLSTKCGHSFCLPCMRQHLIIVATETQQYPLKCPQCQATSAAPAAELDADDCLAALAGVGPAYNSLERLVLEKKHIGRIRYCANAACSMPFDWVDDPAIRGLDEEFCVTCPSCDKDTCVQCKVPWHVGRSCEQYIAEKDGTDALARLAREKAWKACPKCKAIIDRQQGDCNFVRCRCGCGFCHHCGEEYLSLGRTVDNTHGRPNCTCGLFGNPQVPVANVGHVAAPRVVREEPEPVHVAIGPVGPMVAPPRYGDMRDEFEAFTEGENGYVALGAWIFGVGPRGKVLPPKMEAAVVHHTCPYDECRRVFPSIKSLEQHIVSVRWHSVYLCCGRPFCDAQALDMHQEAVHGLIQF